MTRKKNIFDDVFGVDVDTTPPASLDVPTSAPVAEIPTTQPMTRLIGRPPAKKSSKQHRPASAYIEKSVDREVRIALLKLEEEYGFRPEFSDLVNDLLKYWLEVQNGESLDFCWSRFLDRQKSKNLNS